MRRALLIECAIAGAIVAFDQWTKALIRAELLLHQEREIIPGLLNLTRVHNTGVAFGMFQSVDLPMKTLLLGLVATIALAGLTIYAAMLPATQRLTRFGLAFIIGGAAGNLIDRATAGYVLDFVDFYWGDWHFWAFNVADASINVGVGLMILDLLTEKRRRVPGTV